MVEPSDFKMFGVILFTNLLTLQLTMIFPEGLKVPVVSGQTYPIMGGPIQPGTVLIFEGVIQDEKTGWSINLLIKNSDQVRRFSLTRLKTHHRIIIG